MHESEEIIVLFAKNGNGVYPDPDNDFVIHELDGFITWRNQWVVTPANMTIAFSFNVEDAMLDHSVTFIDRLVMFSCGHMSYEQARAISEKLNQDIQASISQHGQPHYVHSPSYSAGLQLDESSRSASAVEAALHSGML